MFPPLWPSPPPAPSRPAFAWWRWWRWCSRMRFSWRRSSRSSQPAAPASRPWSGAATAEHGPCGPRCRTSTASCRPRSSASRSRRFSWGTSPRTPWPRCSATGSRRCRPPSSSWRAAASRRPSPCRSFHSCMWCLASRLPRRGPSPTPSVPAGGSPRRSSCSRGSRGRSPISSTGAPTESSGSSASKEPRPSSRRFTRPKSSACWSSRAGNAASSTPTTPGCCRACSSSARKTPVR